MRYVEIGASVKKEHTRAEKVEEEERKRMREKKQSRQKTDGIERKKMKSEYGTLGIERECV